MIHCNYCENFTSLHQAGARSIGWRLLEEPTGGGVKDAACPVCADRGPLRGRVPVLQGQQPLFPTQQVVDVETEPVSDSQQVHPDLSRCLLEIAAGMEDAASYGKGPRSLQFYATRIRELVLDDHESCDWH